MPAEPKKAPVLQFDRDTLAAVLAKIDPTLTTETLSGLIKATGGTEAAAIKVLFGQVNQLILGGSATVEESDLDGIFKSIETASPAGKLISLAGTDSVKLAALAGSDIGARYALIHGIPFAITGNAALYDNLNRDGSLYKFDPNTGEKRYTDEWLKDRSQFLAVKFNAAGESSLAVAGTQSWTFEERTDAGASRIQVSADQDQRAAAKMIFATGATTTQTVVGSASGDHIYGGAGDDNINAGAGDDYVEGGSGGDMIDGGRGNDTLDGGQGNDIMEGGQGRDVITDLEGNNLFAGGNGSDTLTGGNGNNVFIGSATNDVISSGAGNDLFAFNAGDGDDHIRLGGGGDALSLGGGVRYEDLALSKRGDDLRMTLGNGDTITFDDWYSNAANRSLVNLQVIADSLGDFDPNGSNTLKDNRVELFNFQALVAGFDAAREANPNLNRWKMMNSLLGNHLGGSDSAALGGDLAYQYGHAGSLASVGVDAAQAMLANAQLNLNPQALLAVAALQAGGQRLM